MLKARPANIRLGHSPDKFRCALPKLLVFAACEKVIIDQENNASIITILQEITLDIQIAAKLPAGAVAPKSWDIFALWKRESSEDENTQYEQSCDLVLPDGAVEVPSRSTFRITGSSHRSITRVVGFPIFRTPGEAQLRLYLRESEGGAPHEIASFPLLLKHLPADK